MHWPAGLNRRAACRGSPAHLVDVLPTFSEIAGAKVPDVFRPRAHAARWHLTCTDPCRKGNQGAASDSSAFCQRSWARDGEWKLVSFQSQPWELYHISSDRTELHDVAAQHPDIVTRMVMQWHDMSANVLMGKGKVPPPSRPKSPRRRM